MLHYKGHSGFFRTYKRITSVFYWEGVKKAIENYIMQCQQCQQSKVETLAHPWLLEPLPIITKMGNPYTASEVASSFISRILKLHRFPNAIVSDRDKIFYSQFLKELYKQIGTKPKYNTTFHPQTDCQTKVTNRCLEIYLAPYNAWFKTN